MSFRAGDMVRLVTVPEHWNNAWGVVGSVATVLASSGGGVFVDYGDTLGWYWPNSNIELVSKDVHTPADLAMALELADTLREECPNDDGRCDYKCRGVSDWLRAEVITALQGET